MAQEEPSPLRDPWLVAVWPGMGSVALVAGSYLLQKLGAERVAELDSRKWFEVQAVDVTAGVAEVAALPRLMFFQWKAPAGQRDLLIFVGEAQPNRGGHELCQQVIEYARQRGCKRVFTFAAMATQLNPGDAPRVFVAATDQVSVNQFKRLGAEVLQEGQISGLNGVLLAAAAQRGLRGACLLGEIPFFAVGVPNPAAAQVVLQRFIEVAGIELDFSELSAQAEAVEQYLLQMIEKMRQAAPEQDDDFPGTDGGDTEPPAGPDKAPREAPQALDERTRRRIESLFDRARLDRSKAFELKQELDRLGVFRQFEDRFLDLFRKAE